MQAIKTVVKGSGFSNKLKVRSSWVTKAGTREVKNEEKYTTVPIPFVNDLCKIDGHYCKSIQGQFISPINR
jgi:hypothetical protein